MERSFKKGERTWQRGTRWDGNAATAVPRTTRSIAPPAGRKRPPPADDNGFTAADWLALRTDYGNRRNERARKRIRLLNIDPKITLVFRCDDVIGGGFDLKFHHHPTVYGLDDWDQVRHIVESVTATVPHFA